MAYYRRRSKSSPLLLAIAICVLGAIAVQTSVGTIRSYTPILLIIVFAIFTLGVVFALGIQRWQARRLKALHLIDIDVMDGILFEKYLAEIFRSRGFTNVLVTDAHGDFGADILGTKDGIKYAIQAKRWQWQVGVEAIYQCLGGKEYYGCDACIVITNSTFTDQAKTLAKKSKTYLIDRDKLAEWIIEFQKKKK